MWWTKRRQERELADARAQALRWYERLGGQIVNLPPGDDAATKQALVDAGERYNAAGGQLDRATSVQQFYLARETALEGLAYVRAARVAMKLDPGPPIPELASQRGVGAIRQPREVTVQGRPYRASPQADDATPYYYPGGQVAGRPVAAGWYSEPWWRTALVAGVWGVGGALVFNALLSPGWGDYGYGQGYDAGFQAGEQQGYDQGYDQGQDGGADQGGYDQGQDGGADQGGYDQAAYDDGGYDGGGYDGGDLGDGGYDGGGFDGGGFDGF